MKVTEAREGFLFRGHVVQLEPKAPKDDFDKERLALVYVDRHPSEPLVVLKFTLSQYSNLEAEVEAFNSLARSGDLSRIGNPDLRVALQQYQDQSIQGVPCDKNRWRFLHAELPEIQKANQYFITKEGFQPSTFILTQDKSDIVDSANFVKER